MRLNKLDAQKSFEVKKIRKAKVISLSITQSQWREAIKHVQEREKVTGAGQWRPEIIFYSEDTEVRIHIRQG